MSKYFLIDDDFLSYLYYYILLLVLNLFNFNFDLGPQASDEMCDLFYMYYSVSSNLKISITCDQIENATIARQIEKLDIDG